MTLPTYSIDVWKKSTGTDWLQALVLLASLPSRAADSSGIEKAAYEIALEGTTKHGLFHACKAILQGHLGHAFFPSPAELRQQCDEAMKHHVEMRDRIQHRQRILAERPPERPPLTEAEKERQRARMAKFHASYGERDEAADLAAIRAKYDPELMAKVPDAPLPSNWKRTA